jgi:F-type H+-transporting ATPase subunit epsilon
LASSFQFELVSPEALLVSQQVAMVTLPGGEGDYGVLPGHAPMITTLRPGVIQIYANNDNKITGQIFVAGGFAEVTQERCTLLAEEALPLAKIDRAVTIADRQACFEKLAGAGSDTERAELTAQLAIADAKLTALGMALDITPT